VRLSKVGAYYVDLNEIVLVVPTSTSYDSLVKIHLRSGESFIVFRGRSDGRDRFLAELVDQINEASFDPDEVAARGARIKSGLEEL